MISVLIQTDKRKLFEKISCHQVLNVWDALGGTGDDFK